MIQLDTKQLSGKTIAVGLSGGVDSSIALLALRDAGAKVVGITMKIYNAAAVQGLPEGVDACYGPNEVQDIQTCRDLCTAEGIPYHDLDLASEYESRILDYFKAEYRAGRTPNPCVRCNIDMKFGFLLERARSSGIQFDYFATGHYARIQERKGILHLRSALDTSKDQTYFLHRLPPQTLAGVIFPLGESTKQEVKAIARQYGLATIADKPESQDFIGGDYSVLFENEQEGDIVDESGRVLGRHKGIVHYTIGQRRGIGMSLGPTPMYVLGLDAAKNRVIVSANADLFSAGLLGSSTILHDASIPADGMQVLVRIRQNHKPAPALLHIQDDQTTIHFESPQRAVAPGQSAVFYDQDGFVLGGCIIDSSIRPGTGQSE
ncbi:MAG: tRNA 2-thiouridine(34) synthase MnmA [Spirochaetes bacterium]|nr:tRNA 2-thiouridine(34) synthase MnmA [Spirochaetota bacterium]MBU0957130.1 tRNA 2-thiouridine(34) synthase MnmA [Spirochaetota bacterium]